MIYSKISYGYVLQSYDSETGDCVEQQFVGDGRIERLDVEGQAIPETDIEELEKMEKECELDMLQP